MLRACAGPIRSTPATTGGARTTAPLHIRTGEHRRTDNGCKNEKKDQCVHEQRRNDPFPSFFLLLTLLESRVARGYFTSFGVMPMTLTPAPRAASIALITSEYFTAGSPLTKMILSGRGS
jgi:hypothetical protein